MGAHKRYGRGDRVPAPAIPLRPGTIVGLGGEVLAEVAEFAFSDDPPRPDETIYTAWEGIVGGANGQTVGLELPIKPGHVMVTFKLVNGGPDDCGLVFLKGNHPPPPGTRFALRMLPPESHVTRRDDGEEKADDQTGPEDQGPQGDEGVQERGAALGRERQEGDESEAGDRDRTERERAEPETTPETLGAVLARSPEADAVLRGADQHESDMLEPGS